MSAWRTPKRSAVCSGTGRPFEEDERIFSVLRLTEDGLVREDYSDESFAGRSDGGPEPEDELVWWRTVHASDRKKGLALDFDTIERLFDVLAGREEERLREMRYVVCLLLLRKRRLKMVRVVRSADEEAMVVRRPRREQEHTVPVFDLPPERAATLRDELLALFEGQDLEFEGGEPQPDDPGAAEALQADEGTVAAAEASPPDGERSAGRPADPRR